MNRTPSGRTSLEGDAKRSYVRDMFTAIAPRYDLLNHVLSLNIDRRWRRHAVARLEWQGAPGGTYLDLCAGTLDLAAELARHPHFEGHVVGADFVISMLELGRHKADRVRPVGADALELPFPDATFDGCTVGFGIRNLADIEAGLAEIARVLKRGGRLVILEFATPTAWPIKSLYLFYFQHVLPWIGRMLSKHTSAYSYLPNSVEGFPQPAAFLHAIGGQGFRGLGYQSLTFGVAALYWGTRA